MKRIVILSLLIICFYHVYSQDNIRTKKDTTAFSIDLDEFVVSAFLYNRPIINLPKSASIINTSQVLDNIHSNMVDLLSETPGFSQIWEYHSPILLRGMNSKRLLILQDGCRRIGNFPGGYFAQDMNVYGNNRIEIIKGAGSVIYGSGAVSGIINVINNVDFGKAYDSTELYSSYASNNNEFLELIKFKHVGESLSFNIGGKYRNTDCYYYGDGTIANNTNVNDKDLSINSAYRFDEFNKLVFNTNYHYGDWGKARGFNGLDKQFTKIRNTDENIHSDISYSYLTKGFIESIHCNLFYDYGTRDYYKYKHSNITGDLTSLDLVHYKNKYGGAKLFSVLNLSSVNKLSVGIDAYSFRLDNPMDVVDYYNNTKGKKEGVKGAGQSSIGTFINNELMCFEVLKLVCGLRYDRATISEGELIGKFGKDVSLNAISGNIGFSYNLSTNSYLSFNVGRAYRVPTAEELFTEIMTCKGSKKGNPQLDSEYGWNYDIGFRGASSNNVFTWDMSLFYNDLHGFITETSGSIKSGVDFTYENTNAVLYGGEISSSYDFVDLSEKNDHLLLRFSASYVHGIDKSKNNTPLFGMPPCRLKGSIKYALRSDYKYIKCCHVKLQSNFDCEQNRVADKPVKTGGGPWGYEKSASQMTFKLALGINLKNIPLNPNVRVKINNLLGSHYHNWGSYVPAMGRNIKIMIGFKI